MSKKKPNTALAVIWTVTATIWLANEIATPTVGHLVLALIWTALALGEWLAVIAQRRDDARAIRVAQVPSRPREPLKIENSRPLLLSDASIKMIDAGIKIEHPKCFACGGRGIAGNGYGQADSYAVCPACHGTGTMVVTIEPRQPSPITSAKIPVGWHEEIGPRPTEPERQLQCATCMSDIVYDEDGFPTCRTCERRAQPEDRPFELVTTCPENHYGIHLLSSVEDDPTRVLRTCSQDGCGAQWTELK